MTQSASGCLEPSKSGRCQVAFRRRPYSFQGSVLSFVCRANTARIVHAQVISSLAVLGNCEPQRGLKELCRSKLCKPSSCAQCQMTLGFRSQSWGDMHCCRRPYLWQSVWLVSACGLVGKVRPQRRRRSPSEHPWSASSWAD